MYHRESRSGKYQLTYAEAKAVCEYEGGHLATYQQLEAARKIGQEKTTAVCFSARSFITLLVSHFHECYELWDYEICKLPGLLPKSQAIFSLGNRATSAHGAAHSPELWVPRSPRTSNTSGEPSGRAGKQWYLPSYSPRGLQWKVFITRELL